jgi:hypothetical protein
MRRFDNFLGDYAPAAIAADTKEPACPMQVRVGLSG